MPETITCKTIVSASPQQVYQAWLSSAGHSATTGSPAEAELTQEYFTQ